MQSFGMNLDMGTGLVTQVAPGAQAEALGVKTGWRVMKLNDSQFSINKLKALIAGRQTYAITFQTQESSKREVDKDGRKTLLSKAVNVMKQSAPKNKQNRNKYEHDRRIQLSKPPGD